MEAYFRVKVRKGVHAVIGGPHYEHAIGGVAASDRQRGSGRAYEEASADRRRGRPGSGRLGTKGNERHGNRASRLHKTQLKPVAGIFPVRLPFLGTFRWMCRFGGDGCREEFRPQVQNKRKGSDGVG